MHQKIVIFILFSTLATQCLAANIGNSDNKSEVKKARSLSKDCVNSYSLTCFKLDIVSWIDKLNEGDYNILPGVVLIRDNRNTPQNTAEIVSNLAREFPNDPDARLDAFLLRKMNGFLNSHSLKMNFWKDESAVEEGRGKGGGGGGGGGGGKKGGGGMGMIIAAGGMMKGMMLAMATAAIAAIAKKALFTALISLLLSALLGAKSMHGHKHTTYEIVSKPIHSHSSTHSVSHEDGHYGHSGYGRSFDQPLPIALRKSVSPGQ